MYPHSGEWRQAETIPQACAFSALLRAIEGSGDGSAQFSSLAACDQPNVIVQTAKRAEDGNGWIFRMYESHNKKTNFTLTFPRPLASVSLTSLMETGSESLVAYGNSLKLAIKPYEILTLGISWKE
jgi:alpha-mannosidase